MARIAGRDKRIADWLEKIGINPKRTRRVVIDIPANGAVALYIEEWGDSTMFEIEPPFESGGVTKIMAKEVSQVWQNEK